MIIHSPQPPSPPPKADVLNKPPYMVISLTHRQLAFLGTVFKEDPPLGFYIALVFVPKTHQPSVPGRRTSRTFGEYCTASASSPSLRPPGPLGAEAPPDWPGLGDAGAGHTSKPFGGQWCLHACCCLPARGVSGSWDLSGQRQSATVLPALVTGWWVGNDPMASAHPAHQGQCTPPLSCPLPWLQMSARLFEGSRFFFENLLLLRVFVSKPTVVSVSMRHLRGE